MKSKLIPYGLVLFDYTDNMRQICKEHSIRMDKGYYRQDMGVTYFNCPEGHEIHFKGNVDRVIDLLLRRIDSKKYQEAEYFDIDGYLVPASKETQVKTKGSEYTITAQVKKSEKKGEQIVIYAGKKGLSDKSQIFIDPVNGKLTFDQTNINPKEIFLKIEATFLDGSRAIIEGNRDGGKK